MGIQTKVKISQTKMKEEITEGVLHECFGTLHD